MPSNFQVNGTDTDNIFLDRTYTTLDSVTVPGSIWSWGINSQGQLGHNDIISKSSPVQVGSLTNWKQVSTSSLHTLSTKQDGTLWSWGYNPYGQLGLSDTTKRSSPVQVGALTNWKQVSCGSRHTVAVKTDGTIWSWGRNTSFGELGLNDAIHRSSPTQIGTLTNWKTMSCGGYHTLAIKTDGTLWGWGYNGQANLGLGDTTNRSSPVQIGTGSSWQSISATNTRSFAIRNDGTLWAAGAQTSGALGNGYTSGTRTTFTQIGALTNWKQVSAGRYHTLAIKTDGTLWAWGNNNYGNLGLGDRTATSSPVQVGTLTNWKQVVTGSRHSIAIKTDGTLWSWGFNSSGQLGLNDVNSRSSPVQIGSLTEWNNLPLLSPGMQQFSFATKTII